MRLKRVFPEQELLVLWLLKMEGEIGRYRLAKMLGVPQGIARGILARMKKNGLIMVRHRAGTRASQKGLRELAALMKRQHLKSVRRSDQELLGLGSRSIVFHVAERSQRLGRGIEQRDAAIRAGATGAVTFLFDGKTLRFPGVAESLSRRNPAAFDRLRKQVKMKKGDILLISFAGTWWDAARGGFAAVRTLA